MEKNIQILVQSMKCYFQYAYIPSISFVCLHFGPNGTLPFGLFFLLIVKQYKAALPITSYVTLDKFCAFLSLSFLICKMKEVKALVPKNHFCETQMR